MLQHDCAELISLTCCTVRMIYLHTAGDISLLASPNFDYQMVAVYTLIIDCLYTGLEEDSRLYVYIKPAPVFLNLENTAYVAEDATGVFFQAKATELSDISSTPWTWSIGTAFQATFSIDSSTVIHYILFFYTLVYLCSQLCVIISKCNILTCTQFVNP